MSTVIDSHIDGCTAQNTIFGVTAWYAQIFQASVSYSITGVVLRLFKSGTPGILTVGLYATTLTGDNTKPTGAAITTGTTNGSTLTTDSNGEVRSITFSSPVNLVSGTRYAIVCHADSGNGSNFVAWKCDSTSPTYTNGHQCGSGDAGVNWTPTLAIDMYFQTTGGTYDASSAPLDKTYSRKLIAFGNNEVWYESSAGTMGEVSDAHNDIDTSEPLSVAEAFQKLFIVNGSNFKVLDFVNTKLTTASVGTRPPNFGTVITGGTSGASMIVDYITATSGACTIYGKRTTTATFTSGETVTGTNPSSAPAPYYSSGSGAVSFVLSAAETAPPHWYNWTVFGADATNYGAMPNKAYNVCRYRGRVVITVDPNYPHQWYMTRQKNPWSFLYVAGDAQSPVAGNDADCGEVGDITKVAIPYHDDYLIIGCANEIWYLSGDPAFGGELNILDEHTGILGSKAFCWDNNKNLYLLCTSGLLRIPIGFQSIENLTKELWPDFITDLAFNSSTHRIILTYDPEEHGIHIFKTTILTGACSAWWYDLRVEGLFPDSIPTAMGIFSAHYYQTENPSYKKLLLGCLDGYIKAFDPATKDDDGTIINSYVGFAPLKLSLHPRKDGVLKNIDMVSGGGKTGGSQSDSDDVTCKVYVGRIAENILEQLSAGSTPRFTKVFTAPGYQRGNVDRREVRGQWGGIVLSNNIIDESWSMERLIVDSKEAGRSL